MKCKRHQYEQGNGVCATCLKDRLLALLAAENELSPENHRRDPSTPPILFPQSVSPHRQSAGSDAASDVSDATDRYSRRFFHTPQIGPRRHDGERVGVRCRRFSLFSSFFHHHHHHRSNESEASSSSSWLSSLIHRHGGKKKAVSLPVRNVKSFKVSDRGMSPVRDEEETDDNASESGCTTDSSATWQGPTPSRQRRIGVGLTGFTVCLSPLVRTGPTNRRSQAADLGFSNEIRSNPKVANNRHVSGAGASSFGPNRSRKLADRGRFR